MIALRFLLSKPGLYTLAFFAIVAGLFWAAATLREQGATNAIQKIERANQAAGNGADAAERKRLDCTGAWNRERQTCEK